MTPMAGDEVVRFLEENPGFFLEHPGLLRPSRLLEEGSPSAKVLNLRNRIFDRLKDEREELIRILDETIELVRRNELIEKDFLAIEKLLFQEPPSLANLSRIAEEIERRFSLDHTSFLLFEAAGAPPLPEAGLALRVRLAGEEEKAHVPSAGGVRLEGDLADGAGPLFPEACRSELRSTALVPLRTKEELLGFLLLGSRDASRYGEDMATHLLERLAMRLGLGLSLLKRFAPAPSRGGAKSPTAGHARKRRKKIRKKTP